MKNDITIYDIANMAGVSASTVSRVLTGKVNVRADKKELIEKLILELNYKPNAVARSLLKKRTYQLGFILPDITHSFFASTFIEAEKRAMSLGYTILLCNSLNSIENESHYLTVLEENQVDGILLMGGSINSKTIPNEVYEQVKGINSKIPILTINGHIEGIDTYRVLSDEKQGTIDALQYLINLGHKHIALLGGMKGFIPTEIKIEAYRDLMAQYGYPVKEAWIINEGFSAKYGEKCAEMLLKQPDLPTAIFCINDNVACGVYSTLSKNEILVPEDISIIGFDDIFVASILKPGLSSVNHNYAQLGETAVDVLIAAIKRESFDSDVVIPTRLVLRDSCRKNRSTN